MRRSWLFAVSMLLAATILPWDGVANDSPVPPEKPRERQAPRAVVEPPPDFDPEAMRAARRARSQNAFTVQSASGSSERTAQPVGRRQRSSTGR